ncbi:MAG: LytTR family transcriptional regulator [Lachnospiraceae bacterium]|nr:LytTR family transcriptional regulator [Lachnospiraceae bacterium]
MKITIQDISPDEEEEIIIRCRELDEAILRLVNELKAGRGKFTVTQNDKIRQISAGEIYYIEAVDNRVYLYLQKEVFETKKKLYEIEEEYANTDFFRASKSVILNLSKVKHFAPEFSGRFEATMMNGEKVLISRAYVPQLKKRLGM